MKSKRNRKKNKLIYKIIVSILFLVSIIFVIGLMSLNILSMKWFMLILGVLLLIDFLLWLFIIKSKKKKTSSAFAIIFIIILGIITFYIYKTTGLFTGMSSNYKTYNYSVVVLEESNYEELEDLDKESMGYLDNDTEEEKLSLEHIEEKITPEWKDYEDADSMATELLNENIESIVIEDSYFSMIKEENQSFNSDTKVIYTFKVRVKIEDFSKDVDVTKEPFNIFVSGIDTYGSVDSVSRSDVNMVVTVNPKTKQILMTSIPRDYYVSLHGISGYRDKLTHAGLYGIDMSVKTVEDLLGIEINYYVKVNFSSVIDIVDALGGVDAYSEYTFTSIDGYYYTKGYNAVNGEEALSFARERKAFPAGDNQRIKNQQALIQAIFNKCISKEIIYKYNKLLNSLDGSFITNMKVDRITSLIKMQLDDMAEWTITSNSLTGTDSYNYTYSYASQQLYVMEPDEESVEEAYDLIMAVYDGQVLESSYDENTGESHIVTKSYSNSSNNSSNSTNNSSSSNSATDNKTSSTIEEEDDEEDAITEEPILPTEPEDSEGSSSSDTGTSDTTTSPIVPEDPDAGITSGTQEENQGDLNKED